MPLAGRCSRERPLFGGGSSDPPQPLLNESLLQVITVALMRVAAVCSVIAFYDTRNTCI